ncbi:MAG TPA: lantibiotic dehydratase, partial [Myxococcaceae bacterium]|nr:lantibiotic dehydratase [Myxococcaceae bacterium]
LASLEERVDPLLQFTEAFLAKYGDAAVPLAEALDEETGIPFAGSVRTEDERKLATAQSGTADLGAKEQLLLGKIEESWTTGSQVASLSWEEIASIRARDAPPLPASFCVGGALCASSETALDSGDYQFRLDGVTGPPAWAELGPMASSDPKLRERLARYLREEESLSPGAIFAEIAHFPAVGDPNLVARPRLRAKEISYRASSAAEPEDQISIEDLRLSVAGGRLRLSSQRLNCEVIPRLTAPHDFSHPANPTFYRFLGALQNQGSSAAHLRWSWGALEAAAALPRVVCGKLVLCRARWVLDAPMLEQQDSSTAAARFRALCRIRSRLQLPRFVQTGGARGSTFDLENVLSAESLIQRVRADQRVLIFEMFPASESLCAFGPEGRYVHELTVAFLRASSAPPVSARPLRGKSLSKR